MENKDLHYIDIIKLQYERVSHHENQRLTFSSLVLTITLALMTAILTFNNEVKFSFSLVACFLLISINYIAVVFIRQSRVFIKLHQERARFIMRKYNPSLFSALYNDEGVVSLTESENERPPLKKDSNKDSSRRPELQIFLHKLLIWAVGLSFVIKLC